jgi:hypothetical protein
MTGPRARHERRNSDPSAAPLPSATNRLSVQKFPFLEVTPNSRIFFISVTAISLGFIVMVTSLLLSVGKETPIIPIIAGVISQFIGATFLIVYRSTVSQTSLFSGTLERINAVGMAWAIVDSIDASTPNGIRVKNHFKGLIALQALQGRAASIKALEIPEYKEQDSTGEGAENSKG